MQDSLYQVSTLLKTARESANMTTEEVASRTHIPAKYVVAIDAGDWQLLPDMVYAKGYAKTYARCVGLSQEELISQMDQAIHSDVLAAAEASPLSAVEAPYHPSLTKTKTKTSLISSMLKWLAVAIVLLCLAWLLFLLFQGFNTPKTSAPALVESEIQQTLPAVEPAPATDPLLTPSEGSVISDPVAPSGEPSTAAQVPALAGGEVAGQLPVQPKQVVQKRQQDRLVLRANKNTHIQVRDEGGNLLLDADKLQGETLSVDSQAPYSIKTTEAGDVSGTLNNQLLPEDIENYEFRVNTP